MQTSSKKATGPARLLTLEAIPIKLAVVAVLTVTTPDMSGEVRFSVTDLGTLSGTRLSSGRGINNSGEVVGYADTSGGASFAFLYSGGTMIDLGRLGRLNLSRAYGISDNGQVVGYSYNRDNLPHAFLYSGGTMIDLGTLGGNRSYAYDVNNSGQAVGWAERVGGGYVHAFLYKDGIMTELGAWDRWNSFAYSINDLGQVAGATLFPHSSPWYHAFLYTNGTITDLGTLGGRESAASDINNGGKIVGVAETGEASGYARRAFLYDSGRMIDLGTLGGYSAAVAINNNNEVIGASEVWKDNRYVRRPFLFRDGHMTDLNAFIDPGSGWVLFEANAINDVGRVAGYGRNPSGLGRAFLLTPIRITITCPPAATWECGTRAGVTVLVSHSAGLALTVVWTVNGTAVQTNSIPASGGPILTNVSFAGELPLGTNTVGVSVADTWGNSASCSTTITVVDTTPPSILTATATPTVLRPPNHQMVAVRVHAEIVDACGPATWKIIGVISNEPVNGLGDGDTAPDWVITGDHIVNLRSERSGKGQGRIYSILIQATDLSGNESPSRVVTVIVPK